MSRPAAVLILIAAAGLAGACTPLKGHQGYVLDADLVNSVQPGVDTRDSVTRVLGMPTIGGQYGNRDWYYVARDTRNLAFNNPKPVSQATIRVRFDANGVVTSIDRTGIEQVASISPYGKTTPTLGRERGFFQDLFGNIGTVGAGGGGAPGGNGP
jgi:outer membrane protein assembly factor BamE (lipoprotein component of BamABCDE complex)